MERNYSQPLESLIFNEEADSNAIDHIKASKSQDPTASTQETKSALKKHSNYCFQEKIPTIWKKPM